MGKIGGFLPPSSRTNKSLFCQLHWTFGGTQNTHYKPRPFVDVWKVCKTSKLSLLLCCYVARNLTKYLIFYLAGIFWDENKCISFWHYTVCTHETSRCNHFNNSWCLTFLQKSFFKQQCFWELIISEMLSIRVLPSLRNTFKVAYGMWIELGTFRS